jgi:hypothetical protein
MGSLLRENKATVVAGVIVAGILAALLAWQWHSAQAEGRMTALVHDADGQVHELPLSEDARLEVSTSLGTNIIVVESGEVRMAEADCPNGNCLAQHPLTGPGAQIICLPHQLWIEVVPEGKAGGEMDVSLVESEDDVDLVAR